MTEPLFRFTMQAAKRDPEGYYITRWDQAERMTVLASTQSEAKDKAAKMLGDAGWNKQWIFAFDRCDELGIEGSDVRIQQARQIITDLLEYAECNDPGCPHIGKAKGFLSGGES